MWMQVAVLKLPSLTCHWYLCCAEVPRISNSQWTAGTFRCTTYYSKHQNMFMSILLLLYGMEALGIGRNTLMPTSLTHDIPVPVLHMYTRSPSVVHVQGSSLLSHRIHRSMC